MPFPHAHLTIEAFAQANHSRGPRARGENHAAEDISSSTAYLNLLDDVGSTLIIIFNLLQLDCYPLLPCGGLREAVQLQDSFENGGSIVREHLPFDFRYF